MNKIIKKYYKFEIDKIENNRVNKHTYKYIHKLSHSFFLLVKAILDRYEKIIS